MDKNIIGTIKILEDKIITTKEGITEVWGRWSGDNNNFISYQGSTYKLIRSKEVESKIEKDDYLDDEDENEDLDDE